jgi:hypothetical protein
MLNLLELVIVTGNISEAFAIFVVLIVIFVISVVLLTVRGICSTELCNAEKELLEEILKAARTFGIKDNVKITKYTLSIVFFIFSP